MRRYTVQAHLCLCKSLFDFLRALKSFIGLKHVIGWLRSGGAGRLRVLEELCERFGAMLRAFDAGMKTIFGHSRGIQGITVYGLNLPLTRRRKRSQRWACRQPETTGADQAGKTGNCVHLLCH